MKKVVFLVVMACMMIMSVGTVWADLIMPGGGYPEPQKGALEEFAMPISLVAGVLLVIIVMLVIFISKKSKNDEEEK